MSLKHENFTVGNPGETKVVDGRLIETRDAWGLSCDPMEHADPKCSSCYGRGVLKMVRDSTFGERLWVPCGCAVRRRDQRRKLLGPPGLRAPRG